MKNIKETLFKAINLESEYSRQIEAFQIDDLDETLDKTIYRGKESPFITIDLSLDFEPDIDQAMQFIDELSNEMQYDYTHAKEIDQNAILALKHKQDEDRNEPSQALLDADLHTVDILIHSAYSKGEICFFCTSSGDILFATQNEQITYINDVLDLVLNYLSEIKAQ